MTTEYAAELIATANAIVATGKGKYCVCVVLPVCSCVVGCPVDTFKVPCNPALCRPGHAASRRLQRRP